MFMVCGEALFDAPSALGLVGLDAKGSPSYSFYDPNLRLNVEPDLLRWRDAVAWMATRSHLLKISSEDLALLHPDADPRQVAAEWLSLGVAMVVLTHGGDGVTAFSRQGEVFVEALPVQVIDTVGAGDTFQAALLTWMAEQGLLAQRPRCRRFETCWALPRVPRQSPARGVAPTCRGVRSFGMSI